MAGPSRVKRSLDEDEFENVSEMHVSKSARAHGILASLSPIKISTVGSKYFHAQLTDGNKQTRLVGFDAKVHAKLAEINKTKEPIAVTNCQVKEAKYSSDLEVMVRSTSDLEKSPTKFDIDKTMFVFDSVVMLSELPQLANFQTVNVKVKVIKEKEAVVVGKGLTKQEYVIADSSATCVIVTWEDNFPERYVIQAFRANNTHIFRKKLPFNSKRELWHSPH